MQLTCDKHLHLYGLDDSLLVNFENVQLTPDTRAAFARMAQAALEDGIKLSICSGYRSFERQMAIWNAKANGKRQLLDTNNQKINPKDYTPYDLVRIILIWSALPGCSRHHWGTDIDVYDANQITLGQLKLISSEFRQNGPCHKLYLWLEKYSHQFGFYHPYQAGLSGVSPEPWHLSYFPESSGYLKNFDTHRLASILENSTIALKQEVLSQLSELTDEYVFRVAPEPNFYWHK